MKRERIGIFGGTFHPPHKGHREAAELFLDKAALDRLLIIPTFLPPHKELAEGASAEDRLAMTERCFWFLSSKIEVSDMEIQTGEARYTLSTLRELAEKYPEAELFLYVGSDMLYSFETWHKFEEIFPLCTLCASAREDDRADVLKHLHYLKEQYGAEVLYLGESIPVSSGEVREALARGEFHDLLPYAVRDYIVSHSLYGVTGKEQ